MAQARAGRAIRRERPDTTIRRAENFHLLVLEQDRVIVNRQRFLGRPSIDGSRDFALCFARIRRISLLGSCNSLARASHVPHRRGVGRWCRWWRWLVRRSGPGVAATLAGLAEEAVVLRGGAKAEGPTVGEAATAVVGRAVGDVATAAAAVGGASTVAAVVGLAVGEAALGKDPAAVVPEVGGAGRGPLSLNWAGKRTATWSVVPYLTTKRTH